MSGHYTRECNVFVSGEDAYQQDTQQYIDEVNKILEERNYALLNNDNKHVSDKEEELFQLGVTKISQSEAVQMIEKHNPDAAEIYATPPNSSTCNWYNTGWVNYTYTTGEFYQVQCLIVAPNGKSSLLMGTGNYAVTANNFVSGLAKIGIIGASAYAGSVKPFVGAALTFYDIVSTAVSSISTTTTIENARALVSYSYAQNAYYVYVRNVGSSNERLTLIGNQVQFSLGHQIPSFATVNGYYHPTMIQKTENKTISHPDYASSLYAVAAFLTQSHPVVNSTVNSITFDILGTKKIVKLSIYTTPSGYK